MVVVVDEGHLLSPDQLEQLRILTNFDMDSASPLALLLLGQPTLRRRIKLGAFAAYAAPTIMSRSAMKAEETPI